MSLTIVCLPRNIIFFICSFKIKYCHYSRNYLNCYFQFYPVCSPTFFKNVSLLIIIFKEPYTFGNDFCLSIWLAKFHWNFYYSDFELVAKFSKIKICMNEKKAFLQSFLIFTVSFFSCQERLERFADENTMINMTNVDISQQFLQ